MAFTPSYTDFISSIDLDEVFIDKATGFPLVNGYVKFFQDQARSVGNPVYKITGSSGAYSFLPFGFFDVDGSWRVNLTSVGQWGEAIYYLPKDALGNVQLYFIQIFNSANVFQESRQAWPPGIDTGSSGSGTVVPSYQNFIQNSQFVAGNDYNGTGLIKNNSTGVFPVSWGGWTFERSPTSSSTDFVTFTELFFGTTPPTNPDNQINIVCTAPGGDSFKYLGIRWQNVDKFQGSGSFTFSFWGEANVGSTSVQLLLLRNCGDGGSTPAPVLLATYALTSSYTKFTTSFTFPSNAALIIGAGSYVELAISFPTNVTFDASFTNFLLMSGTVANPALADTTDEQQLVALISSAPIPDTQGNDLYLPLVLTPGGMTYDASGIGEVKSTLRTTVPPGWLLMDGRQFDPLTWSSDGIPFGRIFNTVLWNTTLNVSIGGTGLAFMTAIPLASDATTLIFSSNDAAAQTAATDGAAPTGFTFNPTNTPAVTGNATYNLTTPQWNGNGFVIYCKSTGHGAQQTNDGTPATAFTFFSETDFNDTTPRQLIYVSNVGNGASLKVVSGNGKFFHTANTTIKFTAWYKVDNVGSDPGIPGATSIQINLLSAYTTNDCALITSRVLEGHHLDFITFIAGSSVPASSYFNLHCTQGAVYVWYKVNGVGTDPAVASIGVEVDILSTDGASAVAQKTQIALNRKFFAIPDFRGVFLRGNDTTGIFDIDFTGRWNPNGILSGATPGTYELGQNQSHDHSVPLVYQNTGSASLGSPGPATINLANPLTTLQGDQEAIPVNASVNFMIKY